MNHASHASHPFHVQLFQSNRCKCFHIGDDDDFPVHPVSHVFVGNLGWNRGLSDNHSFWEFRVLYINSNILDPPRVVGNMIFQLVFHVTVAVE